MYNVIYSKKDLGMRENACRNCVWSTDAGRMQKGNNECTNAGARQAVQGRACIKGGVRQEGHALKGGVRQEGHALKGGVRQEGHALTLE